MTQYFSDYYWKFGIPYGLNREVKDVAYKIVSDPYHKRISIEKYVNEVFDSVVYDSVLLDFRHLRVAEHIAWQKDTYKETDNSLVCLIRDQNDRLLFQESYTFERGLCRSCNVQSAHGCSLSLHRMFYVNFQDPFNGVILYDKNCHPVMYKCYDTDPQTGEFTTLLTEEWDMQDYQQKLDNLLKGMPYAKNHL